MGLVDFRDGARRAAERLAAEHVTPHEEAADEKVAEAGTVGACVERLVQGEFDPTGRLALCRQMGTAPSLAQYLGKKISSADDATRAAVAEAINTSVGIGYMYLALSGVPNEIQKDRDSRKIWDAWASHFVLGPDELGIIERASANQMREMASMSLHKDLRELGMTGRFPRPKLLAIARLYGQGGFALRLCQTDLLPDSAWQEIVQPPGTEHLTFDAYEGS